MTDGTDAIGRLMLARDVGFAEACRMMAAALRDLGLIDEHGRENEPAIFDVEEE